MNIDNWQFPNDVAYPYPDNVYFDPTDRSYRNKEYRFVSAKVVADSVFNGKRMTSVVVEFPRWILAEANTHRVFSRSYASSRAIPTETLLKRLLNDPVTPSRWGKNKPGMQSIEDADETSAARMLAIWLKGAAYAAETAKDLSDEGLHKQWASRGIETYITARGIITSTEWSNFFDLRAHTDAQPEFLLFAQCVAVAMEKSTPNQLREGEWHIPFIHDFENFDSYGELSIENMLKCSTARCARASYNNVDGSRTTVEKDFSTFDKLITSRPTHASPAEHQAKAVKHRWWKFWDRFPRSNLDPNFRQYRKYIETGRSVNDR